MPAPSSKSTRDAPPGSAKREAFAELGRAPFAGALFLARAWAAIPLVEVSLRALGYRRTLGWIERVPPSRARGGPSVLLGERLVGAAYRAYPLAGTCLPRSLVQYLLHRRDGTKARFVIGVRRPDRDKNTDDSNEPNDPRIEAHAWVESGDGTPAAAEKFASIFASGDIDREPT